MPKFQILRMETIGTPPVMDGAKPKLFDDPAEAERCARAYSKAFGEKMCVKTVADSKWRKREDKRFETGDYRPLPWALRMDRWWISDAAYAIHKDHFAHASLEKPGWIAYTKSEEDGAKDKQSLLRPGSYLSQYFEDVLHNHGVSERRLVEEFMTMYGPVDVKFAKTADDIVKVYNRGPVTCLHKDKDYPKGIHPASVYAAGDLQIAYLGNIDGKVSARAVVWPAKKLHSRVYGDIARLTTGLQRLGYKWGAPIGAKLKRIQLRDPKKDLQYGNIPNGCFLVPYLDKKNQQGGGHLSVKDTGDHLVIGNDGEPGTHHAGGPDGFSGQYVPVDDEYPGYTCERCEDTYRKLNVVFVCDPAHGDETQSWCRDCTEQYAFVCGRAGRYYDNEEVESVDVDDEIWCKYYADMYAGRCEGNGRLTRRIHEVWYEDGSKKNLSDRYIHDHTPGIFRSEVTNRNYFRDQRVLLYRNNVGDKWTVAKSELKYHGFQCDGCDYYFTLGIRQQTLGDDRLFCPHCAEQAKVGNVKISRSRKIFDEERKQLRLTAAE